jgi:hypothetical protein
MADHRARTVCDGIVLLRDLPVTGSRMDDLTRLSGERR